MDTINMITITLEGKEYQLDIEQAKKLGLFKEKYNRVRSWNEFKRKHPNYFSHLTAQESKAFDAFTKLLKLRRDWIGEWEPDWENGEQKKYVIECIGLGIRTCIQGTYRRNLSFPTQQMAQDFLDTFRNLINEAKILI